MSSNTAASLLCDTLSDVNCKTSLLGDRFCLTLNDYINLLICPTDGRSSHIGEEPLLL